MQRRVLRISKRLEDAEASLAYLKTPMAKNMNSHNGARHEGRVREAEDLVAALKAVLEGFACESA
jgi:hypothetical protein